MERCRPQPAAGPPAGPVPAGTGRAKVAENHQKARHQLFVFVTSREVTATSNGSGWALRPCAVYRKITNGFASEWGAKLYADIRCVVETARRKSITAIDAIRLTLQSSQLSASSEMLTGAITKL